jgi:polyisoprenoid-binding protein YceI
MRYVLDPAPGRFTMQAFARGALSAFAHSPTFAVRDYTGELDIATQNDEHIPKSLHITVKAESLTLTDAVSAKDKSEIESTMRRDVLETATFPEIVFSSQEFEIQPVLANWLRVQIRGRMELHGVTRPHQIDAQLRIMDDGIRLSGEFGLKLSTYHIRRVTALGGLISLQDDLKSVFDLFGRPQGNVIRHQTTNGKSS